jgi:cell wall integrity and stress response component
MTGTSSMVRNLGLALLMFGPSTFVAALDYTVCSSFLTADTDAAYWQYQTNGWCSTHCSTTGTYAYAITQNLNCWCSNYTPSEGSELSRSSCNTPCPAYPEEEQCGGDDAYSYIRLANNVSPSGTRGPSEEATRTSSSQQVCLFSHSFTQAQIPPRIPRVASRLQNCLL